MATKPLGGTPSSVTTLFNFPPAATALFAQRLLNRHSASDIAQAIEVLVDVLDLMGGDPDLEPGGDDEPREADGDTRDAAWIEWTTMRGSAKRGHNLLAGEEDDEDDDPAEEDDPAGQCDEDERSTSGDLVMYALRYYGPGCEISDPDNSRLTIPGGGSGDWTPDAA